MSTFAQFNAAVRLSVFPSGEAESLVVRHKAWITDALIDLQRTIPCLQQSHENYIQPDQTLFHCGASIAESPRGYIVGLHTLIPGDLVCAKVDYDPVSKTDFDCILREAENCNVCSIDTVPYQQYGYEYYYTYPVLPYGTFYPTTEIDKLCRATSGVFTLYRGQLWVYPSLNSDEIAVLSWDGTKTSWTDADIIDDDIYTRDVISAVEDFLTSKAAIHDDCDQQRSVFFNDSYRIKRADLIHECQKTTRVPPRKWCFHCGN